MAAKSSHIRRKIMAGILAVIPLALVLLVLRFLYTFIDQNVLDLVDRWTGVRFPGLGLLIFLVALYLLGVFSSNIAGRWLLAQIDRLSSRLPIVGTTYSVGKQLSATLSLPEKQVFRQVVFLPYLNDGAYTIGFVSATMREEGTGRTWCRVFVPTPPNPTSGTLVLIPEEDLISPGWTIEQGFKAVISAGILGPESFRLEGERKG